MRATLDRGGCRDIGIFASGGIDEHLIDVLVRTHAPIDGFGVGTALTVSSDAAALDCTYKLQEYAGIPRRKRSRAKGTWPGRRQVYRRYDGAGKIVLDLVTPADEIAEGKKLLRPVMMQGRRIAPSPMIAEIRSYCAAEIATLPSSYLSLDRKTDPPVGVSPALRELADELDRTSDEITRS